MSHIRDGVATIQGNTRCVLVDKTQVVEILQEVELTLRLVRQALAVININLAGAVYIRMIHIHVVCLILHHFIQVMVVGHTEQYGVRIGLTQIGLRIECHPSLLVLIPIELRLIIIERYTVAMMDSILLIGKHLPAIRQDLIETWVHSRRFQTHLVTWQYHWRCVQRTNLRCTALQL